MAWFALDDGFDTHPKVRKAGNAAVGLFVRLGVHATKHLTEGHLDGAIVRDYGTDATVRKLIAVGMLHEYGHRCPRCPQPAEGGYFIHDYLDYNKSRAQIEAAREAARKRQNRGRESARRNRNERDSAPIFAPNSRQNGASSARNCDENAPLFDGETAGQEDLSRRDTHEGATGVPSPPLPSHNYDVADVSGETTGSSTADLDAYAPTPIEIDGFQLTDSMRRWAAATYPGLDIEHATQQFISHYRSTGARRKSWPDAWQKWIRDDAKRASERGPRTPGNVVALPGQIALRRSTTDERVAAGLALAAEFRALETQQGDTA
ncbi:hypothetical protein [Streptomyces spinosisporus]|uniref:Uncharacterized protein n=1 Tax=Streptomyces spinosisporus TaxID=2927582 RepID=A0ABS9XWN5_9ACTN|nr:hypothetical protein [Streptomyces spinosisporus]MCI3246488.1 hypothetical protein [Streptomyces spinosisporus]